MGSQNVLGSLQMPAIAAVSSFEPKREMIWRVCFVHAQNCLYENVHPPLKEKAFVHWFLVTP